jgi:hypothetical protein
MTDYFKEALILHKKHKCKIEISNKVTEAVKNSYYENNPKLAIE